MKIIFYLPLLLCFWGSVRAAVFPDASGLLVPSPRPSLGGFEAFNPPVATISTNGSVPVIAEAGATLLPGGSVQVFGDRFSSETGALSGSDTVVSLYSPKTSATDGISTMNVLQLREGELLSQSDTQGEDFSVNLLWVENAQGKGSPWVLNQADALWLSHAQASAGEVVSLFGRNLSFQNGQDVAHIYIIAGGSGQWVTPDRVTPHRVDFTVPASVGLGTVEVWAHNGHGRHYGWSRSGALSLEVVATPTWTGPIINMADISAEEEEGGASALGFALDRARAQPGTTLYFPAGTYRFNEAVFIPSHTRLLGEGKDLTQIVFPTRQRLRFEDEGFEEYRDLNRVSYLNISEAENVVMEGLSLWKQDEDNRQPMLRIDLSSELHLQEVRLISSSRDVALVADESTQLRMVACDFWGAVSDFTGVDGLSFSQCDFSGMHELEHFVLLSQCNNVDVTSCIASNGRLASTGGRSQGGWVYWEQNAESSKNFYFGENTVTALYRSRDEGPGRRGALVYANMYDHVLFEGIITSSDSLVSVAANLEDVDVSLSPRLYIYKGRGLGQSRQIESWDRANGIFTVTEPWQVIPDSSSQFIVGYQLENFLLANNIIAGLRPEATASLFDIGSGVSRVAIADNQATQLQRAGSFFGRYDEAVGEYYAMPQMWVDQFRNEWTSLREGVVYSSFADNSFNTLEVGELFYAHRMGNNRFDNVIDSVLIFNTEGLAGPASLRSGVFENNEGLDTALILDASALTRQGKEFSLVGFYVLGNEFTRRGDTSVNLPIGRFATAAQEFSFSNNVWHEYTGVFEGNQALSRLTIPVRLLSLLETSSVVERTFQIQNNSLQGMRWFARSNVGWLGLDDSEGNNIEGGFLDAEGGVIDLTVRLGELPEDDNAANNEVPTGVIYFYANGFESAVTVQIGAGAAKIEVGQISAGGSTSFEDWQSIEFSVNFPEAPVVVLSPPSFNGQDPAVVRVRNITTEGFEYRLDEWPYLDGGHVEESFFWLAMSEGTLEYDDMVFEAGRVTAEDFDLSSVSLSGFEETPVVLAQVSTYAGQDPVTARVSAVSSSGFSVNMQEQETEIELGGHRPEVITYVAVSQGSTDDGLIQAFVREDVSSEWTRLQFDGAALNPYFFAGMQTANGVDPAVLRYRSLVSSEVEVFVEEETSLDAEVTHTGEEVGVVIISE